MSALGCHANHGATSAHPPIADPYLKWQYVGSRLSRQSRRDVGPMYGSRVLLKSDSRGNVGSMLAIDCHANHGATSAQCMVAESYLKVTLGATLAVCWQSIVTPITARRRPNVW
ncbi:hypothetical protein ALC57_05180 [Trachymyrmex cornetzi]|uniref:Uncharacterized protein n=1 Tax=Trachymyrmex cornetzi TaxID=471704 RepID=A0A151JBL4_9HYME|nr:hypothetical protein ALC57_05180 [Trachymyrmex cornetzi]